MRRSLPTSLAPAILFSLIRLRTSPRVLRLQLSFHFWHLYADVTVPACLFQYFAFSGLARRSPISAFPSLTNFL